MAVQKYNTTYVECSGAVQALSLMCICLRGHKFPIRMVHDLLKRIHNVANATGNFARWRLRLSAFEFDVVQRAGIGIQATNSLLRLKTGVRVPPR